MRIVFAGTPEFAVPSLRAAAQRGEVVAVYTQPDRPAGRGRGLHASPVKLEALQRGIPVLQPEALRTSLSRDALRALQPDLMVVVAYGLILPQSILDIPRFGCWNVHASLLPRWRGAAPIQRAIEAGDRETGVCLMQMAARPGHRPGAAVAALRDRRRTKPPGSCTIAWPRSARRLLADGLGLLRAGMRPVAQPQSEAGVTYAHKLDKAEARLDWSQPAERARAQGARVQSVADGRARSSPASACASTSAVAAADGRRRTTRHRRGGRPRGHRHRLRRRRAAHPRVAARRRARDQRGRLPQRTRPAACLRSHPARNPRHCASCMPTRSWPSSTNRPA